jgi:hypothetical protein
VDVADDDARRGDLEEDRICLENGFHFYRTRIKLAIVVSVFGGRPRRWGSGISPDRWNSRMDRDTRSCPTPRSRAISSRLKCRKWSWIIWDSAVEGIEIAGFTKSCSQSFQ